MAKEIILSTAFLPTVEYMALLAVSDKVWMEAQEHYTKQSFRNRCRIVSANGILDLSVPVIKTKGNHTPIQQMALSFQENWARKHWRAIVSAYNASPYFLYYQDEVEALLMQEEEHLFDYNLQLIKGLCELMEIDCEVQLTEEYTKPDEWNGMDLRDAIHPKKENLIENQEKYTQVFEDRNGFVNQGVSVLDLLFNEGPNAYTYLQNLGEAILKA